jgi:hypothetical protein
MLHGLGELFYLKVGYLTTLSLSRLYSVDDMMIDKYGTVGIMRIGWENRITFRRPVPEPHFHHKSHMT